MTAIVLEVSFLIFETLNILSSVFCVIIFIIFAVDYKTQINDMNRTEEQWIRLYDNAICSILIGRTSNPYYGDWSLDSIVSDAIFGANHLVKKLKEEEQTEIPSPLVP